MLVEVLYVFNEVFKFVVVGVVFFFLGLRVGFFFGAVFLVEAIIFCVVLLCLGVGIGVFFCCCLLFLFFGCCFKLERCWVIGFCLGCCGASTMTMFNGRSSSLISLYVFIVLSVDLSVVSVILVVFLDLLLGL